jgi:hypothetical protein
VKITAEHIRELIGAFGDTVLVPEPNVPTALWVITRGNRHFDGELSVRADTELANQIMYELELDAAENWDSEGWSVNEATAEKIATELNARRLAHRQIDGRWQWVKRDG